MKKFYQVVTTSDLSYDEWIQYEGYSLKEAKAKLKFERFYCDKHHFVELRVYKSENDLDEYNVIM